MIPVQSNQLSIEPAMVLRYQKALLIRLTELTLLDLFKQGKLSGTVHTCIGQEFTGVAIAENLLLKDTIFSNHRCHGHFLSKTNNVKGLLAELIGLSAGVSGGKGGSQHLHQDGFYSNGIQGGIVPVSAGMAFAQDLADTKNISVVFIGDGTLGEGVVYETLNIASKWSLPLLIILEDNQYAQSTNSKQTLSGTIKGRVKAFDIEYRNADTWNINNLFEMSKKATHYVRTCKKPLLLHIHTYRLAAHSKGDDDRNVDEVNAYKMRDPLSLLENQYPDLFLNLKIGIEERIRAEIVALEKIDFPKKSIMPTKMNTALPCMQWNFCVSKKMERINTLIYESFKKNMQNNLRIILIGEDVEYPYGGAFKITRDLSVCFPKRVRNMPISEAAIIGIGNGLALQGYIPVCEIMFGDFIFLAADQIINHAAKFQYMYNEQVSIPLIIRTPMGGRRGYGPTHSQSLEKHFLGIPGIQVIALHTKIDPGDIYDNLFATITRPTLVIENKLIYSKRINQNELKGFSTEVSMEIFPTTRITVKNSMPDITLVCYGGMLVEVEEAVAILFGEYEILVEIICPTLIYPFKATAIIESLEKSKRLLIVEEGQGFAAFGSEVISQIVEYNAALLSKGVRRLSASENAIPASRYLEEFTLPQASDIIIAAKELM